jgi:hypothetical protein
MADVMAAVEAVDAGVAEEAVAEAAGQGGDSVADFTAETQRTPRFLK